MTDAELATFLEINDLPPEVLEDFIACLDAGRRATYERMAEVENELALWTAGLGPKPAGVIVCRGRSRWVNKDRVG